MVKFYYSYKLDLRSRNAPLVTEHVIQRPGGDSAAVAARRLGGGAPLATARISRYTAVFGHKIFIRELSRGRYCYDSPV